MVAADAVSFASVGDCHVWDLSFAVFAPPLARLISWHHGLKKCDLTVGKAERQRWLDEAILIVICELTVLGLNR
ncbi:hypothetical protein XH84_31300 [Bradyrhizobium nanningense]|nr:hypothetical protein XH84_31300 [Bradyrhizobium nanningense]